VRGALAVPVTWTRVPAGENETVRHRLPAAEGDMGESFLVLRVPTGKDVIAPDVQLQLWYARSTQSPAGSVKAPRDVR
jgi:hypothetical protein